MMNKVEITKERFLRFETLRRSGDTNMYDLEYVRAVTWLTKEEVLEIMKNYTELAKKYLK